MSEAKRAHELKGEARERRFSLKIAHKTNILISQRLLRSIGAGQIDFCFIENNLLHIIELKSSLAGAKALNRSQLARIRRSTSFLAEVTGLSTIIDVIWD